LPQVPAVLRKPLLHPNTLNARHNARCATHTDIALKYLRFAPPVTHPSGVAAVRAVAAHARLLLVSQEEDGEGEKGTAAYPNLPNL
jgi:hypothetical protein